MRSFWERCQVTLQLVADLNRHLKMKWNPMNTIKHSVMKWMMAVCVALLLTQTGCRLPHPPGLPRLPGLPPPPLPPFGLHQHQPSPTPVVVAGPADSQSDNFVQLARHAP